MSRWKSSSPGIAPPPTEQSSPSDEDFWVGDVLVQPRLNQINFEARTEHLEHRIMRVLQLLAERPDEVVAREDILRAVWGDKALNDEGLTQAISKLRKALGDRPGDATVIQTIRKVGYRLIAPVSHGPDAPKRQSGGLGPVPAREVRIRVRGSLVLAFAALLIVLFVVLAVT